MQTLNKTDYKAILTYYNLNVPKNTSLRKIKIIAEDILATKLCRCIKSVHKPDHPEKKAIAICRKSVIGKKGLHAYNFKCKDKPRLYSEKRYTAQTD